MSSQWKQDNSTPGTPYVPNEFYDATRGITLSQFESLEGCAKAVPYEEGFIRCPEALAWSIGVVNLSGDDLVVVLNRDKRINKSLPQVRENEKEVNGFLLPNGEASHFNIPPWCYHVTVSEFVQSENGGKKWLTREGFPLADLANQVITYNPGEAEGLTTTTEATGHLGEFAYVKNNTMNTIKVTITKSTTAYPQSIEQIQDSKKSRLPDNGGDKVEEANIRPGGTWHFKQPPRLYTVRALEPPSVQDGTDRIMGEGDGGRVPAMTNYVVLTEANAMAGQIVVLLADHSRNGYVKSKAYAAGELKLVDTDIVQTSRVHVG